MKLQDLQNHWDMLGKTDAFWAILSDPAKKDGKWDIAEFFRTGEEWIAHVMDYVASVGVSLQRSRALDFGCGAGRLTQALCHYFDQCSGIDIAPSMIDLANHFNRYGDRCRYYLNQSDDLRLFEDNTFDFIYSIIVLQHMKPEYSKKYIEEFIRILAPGGLLLFQLPGELIPLESKHRESYCESSITTPLPDSAFKGRVTMLNCPLRQQVGSQLILRVQVENTSDTTWPALGRPDGQYRIKLGNRWLDEDGKMVVHEDGLTVLPHDLKPLDAVELPLLITAPSEPGRYLLEVDMVQHGAGRFGDKGWQPHRGTVNIIHEHLDVTNTELTPKIQMYGVSKPTILSVIEAHGGKIVDVQEDKMAGEHWLSYTYCVTK